ncbi:uncharacterized protein [Choristoneura fumiferana]|uniref:uncharacterized protein n=1 Tax=Choristoneura fumiferana TaxID=7141 RepID=UPI003D154DBF
MLRFSLIILMLYDVAKGSDLEVQARVRMDPDFIKRMEKTLRVQTAILRAGNSLSQEVPQIFSEKEPEKDNNILEDLRPQFSRDTHNEKTIRQIHEERLEKKGIEGIESVAEYLRLKFNFTLDESLVKESCDLYVTKLRSYFKFMLRKEASIAVEQEGIVLDKVDMAVVLQSSLERTLLEEVLAKNSNISNSEKYIMTEAVFLFSMRNKQNEMKYICKTMGICRPFPGFSDQLAQIFSEVLKLYDVKFQYFVIKAAQLIVSKKHFLKTILRNEIFEYLKEKAVNIVDANMNDMRENISVVRSVIIERHRVVNVVDEAVKVRTKAMRIVLDIIDTVFDKVGMEEVQMRAEDLITAIQDWAANSLTDIEPMLNTFITDTVANIKYELSSIGRDEIKVLADIIYFGEPMGNQHVAEYLMTKGSKFVDGIEKSDIDNFRLKLNKKLPQIL